jgi:hypothetical protein
MLFYACNLCFIIAAGAIIHLAGKNDLVETGSQFSVSKGKL